MHPDMWRAFFKEPYRRFYGYIRSRRCIAVHHADSYLVPIVDDMAEIGIQVWQGVLPENDIPALQRHLGGKLVLMGGIGSSHRPRRRHAGGDTLLHRGHPVRLCARGPLHPLHHLRPPRRPSILISTGISMRPSMPTTPGSTCRPLTCRRCPGVVLPRKKQERLPQRSRRRPATFFPSWPEFSSGASRRRCWLLRSRPFPWV